MSIFEHLSETAGHKSEGNYAYIIEKDHYK